MKLNRHHIFLIGITTGFLFAGIHIFNFMIKSDFTKGVLVSYDGNSPRIQIKVDGKNYIFTGLSDISIAPGERIDVIYDTNDPKNASVYTFVGFYMFYFFFLILPMILFTAFIYSWFDSRDYVIVDFKKKKISKSREIIKSNQKSIL